MSCFTEIACQFVCGSGIAVGDYPRRARSQSTVESWTWPLPDRRCFLLLCDCCARIFRTSASPFEVDLLATITIVAGVLPGALLIYFALKHNFLDYGAQRNLVYALSATFLALLYLGACATGERMA